MKQRATFKTAEECGVYMVARLTELTASVQAYNATESAAERDTIENKIKELKDAYNDASRCKVLLECIATGSPVLEACKRRYYPVIKTPIKPDDMGGKVMSTETDVKEIDLTSFNRTVLNGWFYRAELLCRYMTGNLVSDLYGEAAVDDMLKFFKVSAEAAKAEKPSNTTISKILAEIIPLMLGSDYEGRVLNADARYVQECFTKKGKGLTIVCMDTKKTVGLLADVCHRILNGGRYEFAQKQIKEPDKSGSGKKQKGASAPKPESQKPESPKPESPAPAVPEKKKASKASASKKASTPRKSRASAKPTK